jgi:hypothetical protein
LGRFDDAIGARQSAVRASTDAPMRQFGRRSWP